MTAELWLALAGAIATVAAGLYAIHRWGPGSRRRFVRCPGKKVEAEIEVARLEGSFGALLDSDVISCSLLPEGRIDCDKACFQLPMSIRGAGQ